MTERIQKILASAGVASRRKSEELIATGRVTVDGQVVTELGAKADPSRQQITVDGRPITIERKVALILHKPTSFITSVKDPEGRRTVIELISDVPERVYPVGRLDYDSSGLLLFTNDGELANRLLHPRHHLHKLYRVTVIGMPDREALERLQKGIKLEDGMTSPAQVQVLRHHPKESVLEITLHEGRNRQIRRMMEAIGHPVKRLKRQDFGPITLGNLMLKKWRWLTTREWKALYESVGLPVPPYPQVHPKKDSRKRNK